MLYELTQSIIFQIQKIRFWLFWQISKALCQTLFLSYHTLKQWQNILPCSPLFLNQQFHKSWYNHIFLLQFLQLGDNLNFLHQSLSYNWYSKQFSKLTFHPTLPNFLQLSNFNYQDLILWSLLFSSKIMLVYITHMQINYEKDQTDMSNSLNLSPNRVLLDKFSQS